MIRSPRIPPHPPLVTLILLSELVTPLPAVAAETPLTRPREDTTVSPRAPLENLDSRPHRSLSANASQRKDYLTGRELWTLKPNLTLHKLLDLPSWASLSIEERIRYESYDTPWIRGTRSGQWQAPFQTVVFGEIRPSETFRISAEFWDARQWGPSNPNRITPAMVNTLNFSQLHVAGIQRNVFDQAIDTEWKAGLMTMSVGSTRLIGRYAFRNTQQPFLGLEGRLFDPVHRWQLLGFVNTPMALLPDAREALINNQMVFNRPMNDTLFAGLFFSQPMEDGYRLESYLYYLDRKEALPNVTEVITPGIRWLRDVKDEGFDFEIESIGQTGTVTPAFGGDPQPVQGILEHLQFGYTLNSAWRPRLQAQWDYASPEFNPLFGISVFDFGPSGIYGLFSRTNINSPGWRLILSPNPDVFLFFAHRFYWLADGKARTGWSTSALVDPSGASGNYVGETFELSSRWDTSYNLAFQAGWQLLLKGRFAQSAPGAPKDTDPVNYFYVETQFRL